MTKRISIIALIIALSAAVYGLFIEAEDVAYEMENGPRLVTPGFSERVQVANKADKSFYPRYRIQADEHQNRFPSFRGPALKIRNQIDNNRAEILMINEFADGSFNLNIQPMLVSNGEWFGKGDPETHSSLSAKKLNRLIDNHIFPNLRTRKEEKKEILNRIKELNKKAEKQKRR